MLRRLYLLLVVACTSATMGLLGFYLARNDVSSYVMPIYAQSCILNAACGFGDNTRTSALTVSHNELDATPGGGAPVEPNTGETWEVVATYQKESISGTACNCVSVTDTAYVDVSWNGSSWSATCTAGCDAVNGPIFGVDVCASASCGSHSWAYELIVDLANNIGPLPCGAQSNFAALKQVDYTTTSVDGGTTISNPGSPGCSLNTSVSPVSQTWTQTDTGAFECPFTCAGAGGPIIYIEYQ